MHEVFLVDFELAAESTPFKDGGYAGGFVTCIVPTDEIREAINLSERALKRDGYVIVSIEKAIRYDLDEWKHDTSISKLSEKCAGDGELRYSEFDVWGH